MSRRAATVRRATALLAAAALVAGRAEAQAPRARRAADPAPVLRVDLAAGSATAVHAAAGAALPLGTYLRLEGVAGGGVEVDDGESRGSARAEVLARFVLDPLRERGRGVYAAGGLAWWSRDPRAVLVAVLGVEASPRRGWTPALEVGLGRGVRVGLALRRGARHRE